MLLNHLQLDATTEDDMRLQQIHQVSVKRISTSLVPQNTIVQMEADINKYSLNDLKSTLATDQRLHPQSKINYFIKGHLVDDHQKTMQMSIYVLL